MTPRRRVLAAIEHREAHQDPVDSRSTPASGISAIAWRPLPPAAVSCLMLFTASV